MAYVEDGLVFVGTGCVDVLTTLALRADVRNALAAHRANRLKAPAPPAPEILDTSVPINVRDVLTRRAAAREAAA
jgi:hypothetical protein